MVQPNSVQGQIQTRHIGQEIATRLVRRYISADLNVLRVRKLHGGSINRVLSFETDGEPGSIVAKVHAGEGPAACREEMQMLRFFREQTEFPVPEPFACIAEDSDLHAGGLFMQFIPGANLSDARLSPQGFDRIQLELAEHVARLHRIKGAQFGPLVGETRSDSWCEIFQPMIEREFKAVRDVLSARTRQIVDRVIDGLDHWLDSPAQPTLVHGDLWANNIMVDDRHPNRPVINAFLDCHAGYCDPEYELAYLRLFRTVSQPFFNIYRQHHPIRNGFERRCRIYWLNTMMMHVRVFGEQYRHTCEEIVETIKRTS